MINGLLKERVEQTMKEPTAAHIPVMVNEVLEYVRPAPGDVVVDCTLGLGGHARAILQRIGPEGRLIGIDRDACSLNAAKENLSAYQQQCDFVEGDYRDIDQILARLNTTRVDRIFFDLGISSFQLNDAQRGFGFQRDGALDMRMDQNSYISAYDLVNSLSEKEIAGILKNFGQERWYNAIARKIVVQRSQRPIETTQELAALVLKAIPYRRQRTKIHPATRTFQAFRIAVNRELEALEAALDKCIDVLKPGGRIGVIAFHSLEDRIVKNKFRAFAKAQKVTWVVKKPLQPSEEEIRQNPRARSARLRIAERTLFDEISQAS